MPTAEPPRLRIALDVRLVHNSGIGVYIRGLLHGFQKINAPVDWTFIGPMFDAPDGLSVERWIEFNAPLYSWQEFKHYPSVPGVDLLHYPHYNLPLTNAPRRLVTFHDFFHLRYGDFSKRTYQKLFLRRLSWNNAWVLAISDKTAEEIKALSSISPSRIRRIHSGPGRPRTTAGKRPRRALPFTLRDGRNVRPPWFMALGIDKPHKNMDFLIAAMAMWYLRRPDAPPFIWMGVPEDELQKRRLSVPAYARNKIHLEPYTDAQRVEDLFQGALALLFPSLEEGFGFPPIEAMAREVPVVCARRRPMTDLLEEAPFWFDPEDSATLWRVLDFLLDEPDALVDGVSRGLEQASKYNWATCAKDTFALYDEIIQTTKPDGRQPHKPSVPASASNLM